MCIGGYWLQWGKNTIQLYLAPICKSAARQLYLAPSLWSPCTNLAQFNCRHWVYPDFERREVREYQFKISKTALFHNTLVSLPTGMGKTLIAATVMLNMYR